MKKIILLFLLVLVAWSCEYQNDIGLLNSGGLYDYQGSADVRINGDRYNDFEENPFVLTATAPTSTFSIDADGASYANVRRFIQSNETPPQGAIRIEELINYFPVDYADDTENRHPISLNGEVSQCPWTPKHQLIRIGIKGKSIPRNQLPPSNIVLLIDVSGSMSDPDKLELLKKGFNLLIDEFNAQDKVAIVTYAGASGVALPSTAGNNKTKIKDAINRLGAGGSTAGAQGLITAYEIAQQNFMEGGNNSVILGTDGDFNVGPSSQEELVSLIEGKRDLGIFLTVVGVGRGNLNDAMMEQVADHGNGTYEYIDNLDEAKKVFVHEYHKFYPAAKDVKVQVEFNPARVEAYRLIGYENRLLQTEDFEDDKKDAGEISVGQSITALYEIKPVSGLALRQDPTFTIDFRYKEPGSDVSVPVSLEIFDEGLSFDHASESMRFTASVAGFGMLLRESAYKGAVTYDDILNWTSQTLTYDPYGRRAAFREIVSRAKK